MRTHDAEFRLNYSVITEMKYAGLTDRQLDTQGLLIMKFYVVHVVHKVEPVNLFAQAGCLSVFLKIFLHSTYTLYKDPVLAGYSLSSFMQFPGTFQISPVQKQFIQYVYVCCPRLSGVLSKHTQLFKNSREELRCKE